MGKIQVGTADASKISRFYREYWRDIRLDAGLSVSEMARLLGAKETVVLAVEKGDRRYSVPQVRKLIRKLNLDIDEVIQTLLRDEAIHLVLVLRPMK